MARWALRPHQLTQLVAPEVQVPAAGDRGVLLAQRPGSGVAPVSYTHLRAHETVLDLVCRLLLEKKKNKNNYANNVLINITHITNATYQATSQRLYATNN